MSPVPHLKHANPPGQVNQSHFVITPNGELFRYPTIALAKAMWIDQSLIYTRAEQMVDRLTLDEMNGLYRRVTKDADFKYNNKEVAAEKLFPLLCMRAAPHNPKSYRQDRSERVGKLLPSAQHDVLPGDGLQTVKVRDMRLHFASTSLFDHNSPKLAPQAFLVGRYLAQMQPEGGYTWDGVIMDVRRAHDENVLRTRQAPDRIFKYYMDAMADLGLLMFTDKDGRPCDRPRNKKTVLGMVVRHPLSKDKGFLVK